MKKEKITKKKGTNGRRVDLIRQIQAMRGSKVITYITSNRPNVRSDIETADIVHFREHLDAICGECRNLDLFIFSYGGELEAAWELVSLFREYNVDFCLLVPSHARSAATLISLGSKETVMGKMASLGPIDPTVRITGGQLSGLEVSAADMDSFEDFLREEYQVIKPKDKMRAFELLTQSVSPLLIGQAYRNYIETKRDAEKLLRRYNKNPDQVKRIVQTFIKDVSTHNHSISRMEAKEAGLNVTFASPKLEKLMWELYKEYVKDMEMDIPYVDEAPEKGAKKEITFTCIESEKYLSRKVGIQNFRPIDAPPGSHLIQNEELTAVRLPDGSELNIVPDGELISSAGHIFDKTEDIYWFTDKQK